MRLEQQMNPPRRQAWSCPALQLYMFLTALAVLGRPKRLVAKLIRDSRKKSASTAEGVGARRPRIAVPPSSLALQQAYTSAVTYRNPSHLTRLNLKLHQA